MIYAKRFRFSLINEERGFFSPLSVPIMFSFLLKRYFFHLFHTRRKESPSLWFWVSNAICVWMYCIVAESEGIIIWGWMQGSKRIWSRNFLAQPNNLGRFPTYSFVAKKGIGLKMKENVWWIIFFFLLAWFFFLFFNFKKFCKISGQIVGKDWV